MKKLQAKAGIQISKPIAMVFDAIVNPEKMNKYFIEKSTGYLKEGDTVQWKFPEFDIIFPVKGLKITEPSYISFDWNGEAEEKFVEIFLTEEANNTTVVKIVENEMDYNEEGITQMMRQTEGWANFLACLKAYLEYGINLRIGAFDYMKEK